MEMMRGAGTELLLAADASQQADAGQAGAGMFPWLLMVIAVLVIAAAAAYFYSMISRRQRPLDITLLSANVGNANITGIFRGGFGLRDEDVPVIAKNIEMMAPDIVFLQEVTTEAQAGELIDGYKYHMMYEEDTFTAVRKEVFENIELIERGEENPGFMQCIAMPRGRDFAAITLLNVHTLVPIRDRAFRNRARQIRSLVDSLVERSRMSWKVIAAGDFNFDPYRFDSFLHRMLNAETDMQKAREHWEETFSGESDHGLRVLGDDTITWSMRYNYTLDHVISNIEIKEYAVLDKDENRLDVDHTYELESRNQYFMDHRAVYCRLSVKPEPLKGFAGKIQELLQRAGWDRNTKT